MARLTQAVGVGSLATSLGVASACATTQLGLVDSARTVPEPKAYVLFDWHPDAGSAERGTMSATLSDGTHYQGEFFRVAAQAAPDAYKPAWVGWSPYWAEWTGASDWASFRQEYQGEVIANFVAADGAGRMRCRFALTQPARGLAAGASGVCQSSQRQSLDAVIMPDLSDARG